MSDFRYGDLAISVEPLSKDGDWEEYGVRLEAPRRGPYAFRTWYPEECDHRLVAQVLVYDLIEAYENPHRFGIRKSTSPKASKDQAREFLRAAVEVAPYLQKAHEAVYEDWSLRPYKWGVISRKPKEWRPTRRPTNP